MEGGKGRGNCLGGGNVRIPSRRTVLLNSRIRCQRLWHTYGYALSWRLRRISRIKWSDKTKNENLWKAANQEPVEALLKKGDGHRRVTRWEGKKITSRDKFFSGMHRNKRGEVYEDRARRGLEQKMKAVDLTWGKMENEAQCRAQWRKLVGSLVGDQPTPLPRTKSPRWSPPVLLQ